MTPTQHVAMRIVALVTYHSILVTSELHSGIDLARHICSEGSDEQVTTAERAMLVSTANTLDERFDRLTKLASIFA